MKAIAALYRQISRLDLDVMGNDSEPVQYRNTTVFKSGRKTFVFVAVSHKNNDALVTSMLDKLFAKLNPTKLLVELPHDLTKPQLSRNTRSVDKKYWNEYDYAISLALKSEIDFYGVDTSEEDKASFFIKNVKKDGFKVYLLEYLSVIFNSIFRSYQRGDNLSYWDYYEAAKGQLMVDVLSNKTMKTELLKMRKKDYKKGSLKKCINQIIKETVKKYIGKRAGIMPFLERKITAPFPYCRDYKINKINTLHEAYRDLIMIESFIKALKESDRVVMVGGSGHAFITRDFIKKEISKAFGECTALKWKDYDSL